MKVELNQYQGIVVSSKANYLNVDVHFSSNRFSTINTESPYVRILCTRRSKLKYKGLTVNVGDKVVVEDIDWKQKTGVVSKVNSRSSLLVRPPVANVTNIIVLLSVSEPSFDFDQASRFLITAEKSNLDVSLVLTKSDLVLNNEINKYKEEVYSWGYNPSVISTNTGEGIDEFLIKIKSFKLSVLCGPSGVGKSSLINFLIPQQSLSTASVSTKLKRGKHTTRNVELFSFSNGSLIADTPGFNRPDLNINPSELQFLFPELRSQIDLNNLCKFRNCTHRDEPGCVINKNWQRYSFYRDCIEEMIILRRQSHQED